jgi:hypothetical protein
MAIGDDNRFSAADEALWASITALGVRATSLRDWRKEQSPSGQSEGRNFSSGELPRVEDISANDCPALIVTERGALAPDDIGPDFENFAYPKSVIGLIWNSRDEVTTSKKVKRFAELLHAVLVEQRASCFGSLVTVTPNPIRRFEIGAVEFPQFEANDTVAAFGMTVAFILDVPVS